MLSLDVLRILVASLTLNSLASISDFFVQKIKIGALEFKVWMLLVIAVATVVLIILCIMLAVLNAKDRKLKEAEKNAVKEESENVTNACPIENNEELVEEIVAEEEPIAEEVVEEEVDHSENIEEQSDEEVAPVEEAIEEEVIVDEVAPVEEAPAEEVVAEEENVHEEEVVAEEPAEKEIPEVVEENNDAENEIQQENDAVEHPEQEEVASDNIENENKIPENNLKEAKDKPMNDIITKTVVGKLNYYLTQSGYYFSLDANNGQELFVSYSYTSLDGAMKGFETFAKAVKEGKFIVIQDKNGRFKYILNKKYQGPNYKNRVACENSIASVKKFAQSYKVNVIEPDEETKKAFAEYLEELKKAKDVDWDQIAKEEAATPKSGSFEIEEGEDGYRFYLYANNRQILYSSNIYTQANTCRNGIDAFKKAVYSGVVVIEKDKFGNYRYILRNSTTVTYAGESFNNEASARSSYESVKRFVKSATIVPFKKKVDEEE